eukprot:4192552-Lingulodinium_polyedra.AAC.1
MFCRVERDVDIDVVLLPLPLAQVCPTKTQGRPLNNLCRDLMFSAQKVGQGFGLDIERFNHKQDEKKKRAVMGQSVWRATLEFLDMVKVAEQQRDGKSGADLVAH